MKFRPAWTMGALVGIACLSIIAVRYIDRIPSQRLASLLGLTVTVSDIRQPPSPTPRVNSMVGNQAAALGTVVVQTFHGPTLIRQGSGTAVASDGLILTTVAIAPYGSGSYVYQMISPRGQVLRARRVANDNRSGLVLLKADATDLEAVLFDSSPMALELRAGDQLEAIAAQVQVSTFTSLRLPIWVVGVGKDSQVQFSLDRAFGSVFNGSRIINAFGDSVGILRYSSVPTFISSAVINAFLDSYLAGDRTK